MKKMMLLTITILAWCHVACPMDDKQNQLIDAIKKGYLQQVHTLLASGADPNQAGWLGVTPLIWAVYLDNKDIVKLLLYSGANPNQEDKTGNMPLVMAVYLDNKDLVKLLLDLGADPNQEDKRGNTPLMMAVKKDKKDIVELLLRSGANPYLKNSDNKTAFDYDSKGYLKLMVENMIREFTTFLEGSESYGLPEDMLVEIGRKTLPFANDQQIRDMINSVKRVIDTKMK